MPDPNGSQTTLRDTLSAQLDALESTQAPVQNESPAVEAPQETQAQREERLRDEQGRFAKAPETTPAPTPAPTAVPEGATAETPAPTAAPEYTGPSTWKKEYRPIYAKLDRGEPLTADEAKKLTGYMVQREKEFATGVSTYRSEAQNAKELQDAMTPFMADLQAANIRPAQWIANLGNAHSALVKGSPQQKLQMFAKLAQDYGVPLSAIASPEGQQGQLNPVVSDLMGQISTLKEQLNDLSGWRQQTAQEQMRQQLTKFQDAETYPHFETVRGDMAQLLELGAANDLDNAYELAVYRNPETRQAEIERQARAQAEQLTQARDAEEKRAAAAQARARAVSTRTATPSGAAQNKPDAKDRRSLLEQGFAAIEGQSRV